MKVSTYMRRFIICFLLCMPVVTMIAQEYKFEIGGMAGTSSYMGDTNKSNPFSKMGLSGGAVFRYHVNLRWSLKSDLLYSQVSGTTEGSENVFPNALQTDFSRSVIEIGEQAEFNFFPYSDKFVYLGTKRITPYILAGIGFTIAPGGDKTLASLNIPLGAGVKYKLRNRINLGFEYSIRKLFGDGLEGKKTLDDPYQISGSAWKNKDWYSLLQFSLTWEFGLRDCDCNNSRKVP